MKNINVNIKTNIKNNTFTGDDNKGIGDRNNGLGEDEFNIPRRTYIMNAENGLYLTDTNGKVTQEMFVDGNSNQIWKLERLENQAYFIINENTGNAISLQENSTENGVPIVSVRNIGATSQQWRILTRIVPGEEAVTPESEDDEVRLLRQFANIFSSEAIDNPNGTNQVGVQMVQYTRKIVAANNQLFFFVSICE